MKYLFVLAFEMPPLDGNKRDSKLSLPKLGQYMVEIHYHLKCHNFTDNTGDI